MVVAADGECGRASVELKHSHADDLALVGLERGDDEVASLQVDQAHGAVLGAGHRDGPAARDGGVQMPGRASRQHQRLVP